MFTCDHCGKQSKRIYTCEKAIAQGLDGRACFRCDHCHECARPSGYNPQLNQTLHKDKFGTKVTVGKAWEIANRTRAEDGKTIINRVTGKPAQR